MCAKDRGTIKRIPLCLGESWKGLQRAVLWKIIPLSREAVLHSSRQIVFNIQTAWVHIKWASYRVTLGKFTNFSVPCLSCH